MTTTDLLEKLSLLSTNTLKRIISDQVSNKSKSSEYNHLLYTLALEVLQLRLAFELYEEYARHNEAYELLT